MELRTKEQAVIPAGTSLDLLLDTEIPLTVRFGSTRMLLQDLVRLGPGSVVDLNRGMDEPVDIPTPKLPPPTPKPQF